MTQLAQIISGGQTGADRAALDTAIKFNIPHGGFLPRGRRTEKGTLPERYRLTEMPTREYPPRTRKNIMASDGTLIVARGPLKGGSKLTLTMARQTGRPVCHIDLLSQDIFEAAILIQGFILDYDIKILNVAGPRASSDFAVYNDVRSVLEAVLYLFFLDSQEAPLIEYPELPPADPPPDALFDAVSLLQNDLDFRSKTRVGRMHPENISVLYFSILDRVRFRLGLDLEKSVLFERLRAQALHQGFNPEDAVMVVLKELHSRLSRTHALRVVP